MCFNFFKECRLLFQLHLSLFIGQNIFIVIGIFLYCQWIYVIVTWLPLIWFEVWYFPLRVTFLALLVRTNLIYRLRDKFPWANSITLVIKLFFSVGKIFAYSFIISKNLELETLSIFFSRRFSHEKLFYIILISSIS